MTARILLINPNTTQAVTERLTAAAGQVARDETRIIPLTAPRGVPYIATRAEAQIGGAIALEMLADHHHAADAAIIAAFGDPGLHGARELFDIPVIGMSEAAMLSACMCGKRFSIVTFATALGPWYRDCVAMHGLSERCAGIHTLAEPFRDIADVAREKKAALVALAQRALADGEADTLILAGAPIAGLAREIAQDIPVPVIDPIQAALVQIEGLLHLAPRKATTGPFARPAAKPCSGLPDTLAARIGHRDG